MRLLLAAIVLFSLASGRPASGADDPPLLLADDFSTLKPGWGSADEGRKVEENKLVLTPKPGFIYTSLYQEQRFGDMDLRVKISCVQGGPDNSGSVVFWATDLNNLYAAEIYTDGTVQVSRKVQGKFIYPVGGRVAAAAKQGLAQANELRVVTSGDRAAIHVNGELFAEFRGFPPDKESKIGLRGASSDEQYVWTFSDLTVRPGPAPAVVRAAADESVVFADDFSTPDASWGPVTESVSGGDGKLVLKPSVNKNITRLYRGRFFEDGDIRVNVVPATGGTASPAGLIFWAADLKNYHVLWIRSDGAAKLSVNSDTAFRSVIEKTGWNAVNQGLGAVNELRVVLSGRKATAYVNDQKLGEVDVKDPPGPRQVGLMAESDDLAYAWEFSDFRVRKVVAETSRPLPEGLLAADDFSTLNPAWGTANERVRVSDGKLILKPNANAGLRVYYGSDLWSDMDVRVKASQVKGQGDGHSGIVFWGSKDGFYAARFDSDGHFNVTRYLGDKILYPVEHQPRTEVVPGIGAVNELRVVTSGNLATVYINGREVSTFKGFPPEGGGKVGLIGSSAAEPYEWAFSEFSIRQGPPPKTTAPSDSTLLFADDFATLDPSWRPDEKVQKVSENKLVTTPLPEAIKTNLYSGTLFGDADIRVNLTLTAGERLGDAGVIFWASDYQNYYVAELTCPRDARSRSSNGFCRIIRRTDGKDEKLFGELHKDVRHTNALRIVTKGDSVTFYINEKQAATITGVPPKGGGRIGFRAKSPSKFTPNTWTFSDLVVRKPASD